MMMMLKPVAAVKPSPADTQQTEEVYEETRTVEEEITFTKQRQAFAAVDATRGV